ncbi:Copia protein, partial [Mucuna pruriens]
MLFLHGNLKEEVYMDIPPRYTMSSQGKVVYKLQKTIYGLEQSPVHGLDDKYKNDKEEISRLQKYLTTEFEMKNLGGLKYFLDIEVARSETIIRESTQTRNQLTRKDIKAISVVSQFMHCPSEDHMNVTIQIIRYLKSTRGKRIMFSKNNHLDIGGCIDSDWVESFIDRRSTSSYLTFVGRNLVAWRSKKQKVVSLLSAKAKFRVIAIAHNPTQQDRTKHVEVDRHFIKQILEANVVQDQLTDIFIKVITSSDFHNSLDKSNMKDIYAPI